MAFSDGNTASETEASTETTTTDSSTETTTDETEASPKDVKALQAALKKANADAERQRRRLKELEDRDKTELQRATEKATDLESKANAAELRALRMEVAIEAGLPKALAARLQGTTVDELQADAKELLRYAGNGKPPPVNMDGGADKNSSSDEGDMNKLIRSRMRR